MKFRAFISYRHVQSTRFAERLELAVKAYAKPVYRPPIAIFRDEKHLRAGGDLPALIRAALEASEFLIFLASPEAAASPWVRDELSYWCADADRCRRLIIVLTAGTLATDAESKRIDWTRTDCLPPALANTLVAVPFYVDLSWARRDEQQTVLDPDYKKAVNLIVATLRNVDPIELSGEEVLQHRRNLRIRRAFVASLAGLAMLLAGATWFAWTQKRLADAREQQADQRAREATSRRLAGEADRLADEQLDRALLLMAQAHRMSDNTAIRASWWRLLGLPNLPQAYLGERGSDVRFEEDGSLVVTTDRGGVSFVEENGVWTRRAIVTMPAIDWEWKGGCQLDTCDDAPIWRCARSVTRVNDPYGLTDDFCVRSALRVPQWCGEQVIEVPGYEVHARRSGRWLDVSTHEGSAAYLCSTTAGDAAPGRIRHVSGGRAFYTPADLFETIDHGGQPVTKISRHPDGRLVAVLRKDGAVEIWVEKRPGDAPSRPGAVILAPDRKARAVATSPGGLVAVAQEKVDGVDGAGGDVLLWRSIDDARKRLEPHRRFSKLWPENPIRTPIDTMGVLAISDDGQLIASGSHATINVISIETARRQWDARLGRNRAVMARFSPIASLGVVVRPNYGAIGDMQVFTREYPQPIRRIGQDVRAMAFVPADPLRVLTAGDRGVHVWSVVRGREPQQTLTTAAADRIVTSAGRDSIVFSVVAGSDTVPATHLELRSLSGGTSLTSGRQDGRTHAIDFHSTEDAVLWASSTGLHMWSWPTNSWTTWETVPHSDVRSLGSGLVLALRESHAVVYDLRPSVWLELTCALVRRSLTEQEWTTHIGAGFRYESTCGTASR